MSDNITEKTKQEWRESAQYWRRHESTVRSMFTPLTDALIRAAEFRPGQRVLDIAGGPGEPSLRVAEEVGPTGRVVHTDLAWDMLLAARDEAGERGLACLDHVLMSGDAIAFADRSFDRVVSRLGFMFMPEPVAAAAEFVRTTRRGGRIVLVVWGARETNPYFRIPADVVNRYVTSEPDPPDAPTAWRYAERGRLARIFEAGGASRTTELFMQFDIATDIDFDTFWTSRRELSGSLREKLGRLDAATRARLEDEVRDEMSEFFSTGAMRIPAEALVVTAFVD